MRVITGVVTNGVTLAAGDSPVLIGGVVTNDGAGPTAGVYGGAGIYGDIRNFGTVGDAGGTFIGVELAAGGTITNGSPLATDALITGSGYGLKLTGDTTVTNFGAIESGIVGARFLGGGRITNEAGAAVSGGIGEGVSFEAEATVVNFGTIASAEFVGVDLLAGGRITNGTSAVTTSRIDGYTNGISFGAGSATLSNFGTVTATTNFTAVAGVGTSSFLVSNGSASSNKAFISGGIGVASNESGTIENFGTILGSGAGGEGVKLVGGAVANGSAASTTGEIGGHFVGVYLTEDGRITNFGTISGDGVGILLTLGGTIVNGGSTDLAATIGNGSDGIDIFGADASTVTNFGTISGAHSAISFGEANDVLIVEPGAEFVGAVTGGDGVNTAVFNGGGTLDISNFSAFEIMELSSTSRDTLTLTKANFAGVVPGTITVTAGAPGDTLDA